MNEPRNTQQAQYDRRIEAGFKQVSVWLEGDLYQEFIDFCDREGYTKQGGLRRLLREVKRADFRKKKD